MKSLWSTAIAAAMILSFYNCTYADVVSHKEAIKKSESVVMNGIFLIMQALI